MDNQLFFRAANLIAEMPSFRGFVCAILQWVYSHIFRRLGSGLLQGLKD